MRMCLKCIYLLDHQLKNVMHILIVVTTSLWFIRFMKVVLSNCICFKGTSTLDNTPFSFVLHSNLKQLQVVKWFWTICQSVCLSVHLKPLHEISWNFKGIEDTLCRWAYYQEVSIPSFFLEFCHFELQILAMYWVYIYSTERFKAQLLLHRCKEFLETLYLLRTQYVDVHTTK